MKFHEFLIAAVDGGDGSISSSGLITPIRIAVRTDGCPVRMTGPQVAIDVVLKRVFPTGN
jgi:hypothetical protein